MKGLKERIMELQVTDKVKRPIGAKVLTITTILLLLMAVVTYISNSNLKKLNSELAILSNYFIPLDQILSDFRANHIMQILYFERILLSKSNKNLDTAREEGEKVAREIGACERVKLREATAKLQKTFSDPQQKNIALYQLQKGCADNQLTTARALVEKALTQRAITTNPVYVQQFTKLEGQLANIPRVRDILDVKAFLYLTELSEKDFHSAAFLKEELDTNRKIIGQEIGNVSLLLHVYTRQAAAKANDLEIQAIRFNWGMTLVAAILGLVFAILLTRNLVRPVRQLLTGAKAIEKGDLNVQIKISSADEIALLAQSFNYMVSGLKEKEKIKETFGKYIDPRIVNTLLDGQSLSPRGEKRVMTLFFSDIMGFTDLCEKLTPDGVVRMLNHYFSSMSEAIRDHKGIIDKYIGDAIMAFWGPPFVSDKEHALLACYAALEQQAGLEHFKKMLPDITGLRKGLPDFTVLMGIGTGEVTVGTVGAESAKSYTVIGDTVNLASRLVAANKQYGTHLLISESTFLMTCDHIEARELDLIIVAGKSEPVRVYELLGRKNEINKIKRDVRDRFEEGLRYYWKGEWKTAMELLKACLEIDPEDGPAKVFLSRINVFMRQPPPSGWSGVWIFDEK
jgi:adenylate cyclase